MLEPMFIIQSKLVRLMYMTTDLKKTNLLAEWSRFIIYCGIEFVFTSHNTILKLFASHITKLLLFFLKERFLNNKMFNKIKPMIFKEDRCCNFKTIGS